MSISNRSLSSRLPEIFQYLQQQGASGPWLQALQQHMQRAAAPTAAAQNTPNIIQVAPISDPILQSQYAPFAGALPTAAAVNPWGPNNHRAYDTQGDMDMRMALGGAGAQMPVSAPIRPAPQPVPQPTPRPTYPGPTGPGGPANPVPQTPTAPVGGQIPGGYWANGNDVWRRVPSSQRAYPAGFSNPSMYFDDREQKPWGWSEHVPWEGTNTAVTTPTYSNTNNFWRTRTNRPSRWA